MVQFLDVYFARVSGNALVRLRMSLPGAKPFSSGKQVAKAGGSRVHSKLILLNLFFTFGFARRALFC